MARGQGKRKQRGASGEVRDASSNLPGTKEDRGIEPTPFTQRPGPRAGRAGPGATAWREDERREDEQAREGGGDR